MKKLLPLFIVTALISCNNKEIEEQKSTTTKDVIDNNVLWAETAQSVLPLEKNSLWTEEEWKEEYKYDKELIFSSITKGVLSGKLKAYSMYPDYELSIKEFQDIIGSYSTEIVEVEDPEQPGSYKTIEMKQELQHQDLSEIKFVEKIKLDTSSYSLTRDVSSIQFYGNKYNSDGEKIGLKRLFDVAITNQ